MEGVVLKNKITNTGFGPAFVTALSIVLYLFYVDEGYYDFRWMRDAGNWIAFCIYLSFIFAVMWLISSVLYGRLAGLTRWVMVMTTGFAITLLFLVILF